MKKNFEIFQTKKWMVFPVLCLLALSLTVGCASSSKTVKSETLVNPTTQTQTTVVEKETVRTTDSGQRGLLGGIFHVAGEMIAFPFEVVANVFRFIF